MKKRFSTEYGCFSLPHAAAMTDAGFGAYDYVGKEWKPFVTGALLQ